MGWERFIADNTFRQDPKTLKVHDWEKINPFASLYPDSAIGDSKSYQKCSAKLLQEQEDFFELVRRNSHQAQL